MAVNDFLPGGADKKNKLDSERLLQLTIMLESIFSTIVHLVLLTIFYVSGILPMVYLNVGSVSVAALCFLLLKSRKLALAGLLLCLETIFYAFGTLYYIGPGSETILYFFLILILQLLIPYAHMAVRTVMCCVLWVGIIAYVLIGNTITPAIAIPNTLNTVLTLFNIQMVFWGIVIVVPIDVIIEKVMEHLWGNRLEELEEQAYTDQLTGLYNRRYAGILFEKFRREPPQVQWCVAMLDIDDFKLVNDRYGHGAGDVVLKALSQVITLALRKTDVVIRWGGEEFLLLMEDIELAKAFDILEKLRKTISETEILTDSGVLRITVTIGVEPLAPHNIEGSIKRSDSKLYQGKATGKNRGVM